MGPEVDVRDLKFKGISEISGEFFVEDVTPSESGNPTRRLLFQGIVPLIQTEVILKPGKYLLLIIILFSLTNNHYHFRIF